MLFNTKRERPFDRSQQLIDTRRRCLGKGQEMNMGRHIHEGHEPIVVSGHRLFDAAAEQHLAAVIGQQREPPEAREGQLVIVAGIVEMGDSFPMK